MRKGQKAWNAGKNNVELYGPERAAELRKARQEFTKGNQNALGHVKSEESNKKNRQKHLGKSSGNRGNPSNYHHPPKTIEIIREASKNRTYPERKGKTNEEFYGVEKAEEIETKKSESLQGRSHLELLGSQERVEERNRKFKESVRATWEEKWKLNPTESRDTTQYYEWRELVLTRDNYTCQHCGVTEEDLPQDLPQDAPLTDRYLHAHHLKSWSQFVALRYVVSNGQTLCPTCHRTERV